MVLIFLATVLPRERLSREGQVPGMHYIFCDGPFLLRTELLGAVVYKATVRYLYSIATPVSSLQLADISP